MGKRKQTQAQLANLREPWKKGESGNPNGRPKNRVKEIHDELGIKYEKLTKDEYREIDEGALSMGFAYLRKVAKSDDVPAYEKNVAMSIITDTDNGKTTTIDKVRERLHGKVAQSVELTGKDGKDINPLLQVEVIDTRAQLEEEERDGENTNDKNI